MPLITSCVRPLLADLQLMLWPKRIVIPLLPEDVTGSLENLYLRHQGVLQVRPCS